MNTIYSSGKILKGALINSGALGAKIIGGPALLYLIANVYSSSTLAVFFIAYSIVEIAGDISFSGFMDAVLFFGISDSSSKEMKPSENIFGITLVFSLLTTLILLVFAPLISVKFFQQYADIDKAIQFLALGIPFEAITRFYVTLPKIKIKMQYDAIMIGIIFPVSAILLSILFSFIETSISTLALAFSSSWVLTSIAAVVTVSRQFDFVPEFKSSFHKFKQITAFSIPQSLNMAFNRSIASMDILILGFFNTAPHLIALYGLVSQIVKNLRHIRLVFSSALSPALSKMRHKDLIKERNLLIFKVISWIFPLLFFALIILVSIRFELFQLIEGGKSVPTTFFLILLVSPFMNILFGLAGNTLIMSGYSKLNFLDSIFVGLVNLLLNLILIPKFGLSGAAAATSLSMSLLMFIQLYQGSKYCYLRYPFLFIINLLLISAPVFLIQILWFNDSISIFSRLGVSVLYSGSFIFFRAKITRTEQKRFYCND
ncbi:MAG: polysaccharide biosynthesis C-terminal domain-containing protein [Deltaproteobacteria bacterium]|nr:polysaccharide biosynthesis C-terminal domain-containing protein [Deltaproteobacteria bacterium]